MLIDARSHFFWFTEPEPVVPERGFDLGGHDSSRVLLRCKSSGCSGPDIPETELFVVEGWDW